MLIYIIFSLPIHLFLLLLYFRLIKKRIEKLKDPALQVAELILDELVRIAGAAEAKTLSRFPVLRERVGEVYLYLFSSVLLYFIAIFVFILIIFPFFNANTE